MLMIYYVVYYNSEERRFAYMHVGTRILKRKCDNYYKRPIETHARAF